MEEGAAVEGAALWQDCKIGKETRLRNCMLASSCSIEERVEILDNCVLGDSIRIGKGNRLSQGIRIWPNKSIEPDIISF
ncbi:MAG: hypothetical protein JW732_01685 [Dehalococcoidia bacterium]|nr:hypothetical protein [Dehalococcoidia bacterium]